MKDKHSFPSPHKMRGAKEIFCDLEIKFGQTCLNAFIVLLSFHPIEFAPFFKIHNLRKFFSCTYLVT